MLNKIVKIFGYVIIGVSALVWVLYFVNDAKRLESELDKMKDDPQEIRIAKIDAMANDWGGLVLNYSLYLFAGAAILAIGFPVYKFITDAIDSPKSAIKPAIVVVVVGLVAVVSYSLAGSDIPVFLGSQNFELTPATCKYVEASLYGMYIFFAITILALVYTELSRIWR